MEAVTHEEYIEKWYKYCDDYFCNIKKLKSDEKTEHSEEPIGARVKI